MDRRLAIKRLAGAPLLASGLMSDRNARAEDADVTPFRLTTFASDITPTLGSPLCGGWIPPAKTVDDPLRALGIVLLSRDKPIVLCALDWVENNNSAYDKWRETLAAAAGTDANRVAVQCVHPHDSPWANLDAHEFAHRADTSLHLMHPQSFHDALRKTGQALKRSLTDAKPITHVGAGQARVINVASARRILGSTGKVIYTRNSSCADANVQAHPEGLIDPFLKMVSFWNKTEPVAALHYYATHPMSRYGLGRVSSDFCGLARDRRQRELPGVFQIYFTGCAGDVTAGKYNDGTSGMRQVLADRIHAAMVNSWEATERRPINAAQWFIESVKFRPRTETEFGAASLRSTVLNAGATPAARLKAAIALSWLDRVDKPVEISCLRLGRVNILHLPGEPFVHYQLLALRQRPDDFVCVAGYGDGGMGYIPRKASFSEGGYEPTMSFIDSDCEDLLAAAITQVLKPT